VHFGIEAFRGCIAVKSTLKGENEMLNLGWLPYQPFHAFDDIPTPVLNRSLAIVIPSQMFQSV